MYGNRLCGQFKTIIKGQHNMEIPVFLGSTADQKSVFTYLLFRILEPKSTYFIKHPVV